MNINATLLGEMITFAILIWVTAKYIWPPIMDAIDERSKKISEGLEAARKGLETQEEARRMAEEELVQARRRAAEILADAQKRISKFEEEEKEKARIQAQKILAEAKDSVDAEILRSKDLLREQLGILAIRAAEQILRREIDQAKHSELLDQFKAEL